ncbi:hypothetical protein BH23GEM7_BH23GEM7_14560 [soil metagenome]
MPAPARTSPGTVAQEALAEAFRARSVELIDRIAQTASAEVLGRALAEVSALDGLVRALSSVAPALAQVEGPDPLAEAMAQAATVKRDLLQQAGGTFTTEEVAERLGISRQAVDKRRGKGTLLAVSSGTGAYLFPRFQFDDQGAIAGLGRLLPALPMKNPWTQLAFLLRNAPELGGRTALEALRDRDVQDVLDLAEGFGDQGGHV